MSDEQQVAALVDQTVAFYGRLDMAFNNAGIQAPPSDAADEPASLGGLVGLPGRAAHHASRHGVLGLTSSAPRGIQINAICPGTFETPMSRP